jgi:hypothetical protein
MGKDKGKSGGRGGGKGGKANEWEELADPIHIRFMHSKIRPKFSDGKLVQQTLDDIVNGKLKIEDIPKIVVIKQDDTHFYSMNNRRLWVFKQCRELGILPDNKVVVRVRPMPQTKRLQNKFDISRCSDTAKFFKEKEAGEEDAEKNPEEADEGDEDLSAIEELSIEPKGGEWAELESVPEGSTSKKKRRKAAQPKEKAEVERKSDDSPPQAKRKRKGKRRQDLSDSDNEL